MFVLLSGAQSVCRTVNIAAPVITQRPARIWKNPVRKNLPPLVSVNSWQKNMNKAMTLKMMERIIIAWTACSHSLAEEFKQCQVVSGLLQFCQRSAEKWSLTSHLLTMVETKSSTRTATCRTMIPNSNSSIFNEYLG